MSESTSSDSTTPSTTTTGAPVSNFSTRRWAFFAVALAVFFVVPGAQAQVIDLFEDEDLPEREEGDEAPELVIERGSSSASAGHTGSAMRIEYRKRGGTIFLPVRIGRHEAYIMLDTGASYTTLTRDFARTAGVFPPDSAPKTMTQTAGGARATQFGLIGRMQLGRHRLENVTYTLCDPCGMGSFDGTPVVGLLGMNVLGRFRMDIDDTEGVVELRPHRNFDNRRADIEPWLEFRMGAAGGELSIYNQAEATIANTRFELECVRPDGDKKTVRARTSAVRARSSSPLDVDGRDSNCRVVDAQLTSGSW